MIPVLLLEGTRLVKTIGFERPSYVGDPMNAVRIFNDAEADELIFLDIAATREGRLPPVELVRQISDEAFMPFTIGGGIERVEDVRALLGLGAEKVAINSAALERPELLSEAASAFGAQAVVASIDARREPDGVHRVYSRGGTRATGLTAEEAARRLAEAGCGEILVTSIDRDGTMGGYDLELVARVTSAVEVPVIACGGAGDYRHLRDPIAAGAAAVAAGSLFVYVGRKRAVMINYPDKDERP